MTQDIPLPFDLPAVGRKKLTIDFEGGNQSSDAGLLLLRQAEKRLGVCRRLADAMPDRRDPTRIRHEMIELVTARTVAISCGYKVVPYGVYDVGANAGWVSLGITADTAEFAVNAIRTWIERIGRARYPHMRELTITADCGGSNGARVRLWKVELQKLADESGLTLRVLHYPPGTSKWNKIEHRLFCHITQNWRGQPLKSRMAVVELIGATTTKTGLTVECALDERTYEKGIRIK